MTWRRFLETSMGFQVNVEKSDFILSQTFQHLRHFLWRASRNLMRERMLNMRLCFHCRYTDDDNKKSANVKMCVYVSLCVCAWMGVGQVLWAVSQWSVTETLQWTDSHFSEWRRNVLEILSELCCFRRWIVLLSREFKWIVLPSKGLRWIILCSWRFR